MDEYTLVVTQLAPRDAISAVAPTVSLAILTCVTFTAERSGGLQIAQELRKRLCFLPRFHLRFDSTNFACSRDGTVGGPFARGASHGAGLDFTIADIAES